MTTSMDPLMKDRPRARTQSDPPSLLPAWGKKGGNPQKKTNHQVALSAKYPITVSFLPFSQNGNSELPSQTERIFHQRRKVKPLKKVTAYQTVTGTRR